MLLQPKHVANLSPFISACLLFDATGLTLHSLMTDISGTHAKATHSSGAGKDMIRVELALMAAVVVAVKLVYILDGEAELNDKVSE